MKLLIGSLLSGLCCSCALAATSFQVFVSNERDGTVSVIDGATRQVTGTIEVGKRPRGIHASPDGGRITLP